MSYTQETVTEKRCPYCFAPQVLSATQCNRCRKPIGVTGKHGIAKKPVHWKSYLVCFFSWGFLFWYLWWAFFRDTGA